MRNEFFNTKNIKLDLYMINCGIEDCCANFVCLPHTRNYYLIHYVTKGYGYYQVDGQTYKVSQNTIFIIYPNQVVTYYSPDIDNTWSFCWIGFSGKGAESYLKSANLTGYTKTLKSNKFCSCVANCLDYINENKNKISQIKLNTFVLDCLYSVTEENEVKHKKSVEYADKAVRYIEYNYMNEISAKDVSDYLCLDRTYFYRIFKKYTSLSPERYIMNFRIKKSLELLESNKYSITEIAGFVGIKDIFYFSRLFKKITGTSPSKYKSSKCTNVAK